MIYRLEIENYFSVREPQVIDLTVGLKAPDEPGRLIPIHDGSDQRAPRVVAIYGANASGKSNVLRALSFIAWFVRGSFMKVPGASLPYQKFQTQSMINKPTTLSVSFAGRNDPFDRDSTLTCHYVYKLVLAPRTDGHDAVIEESLHYRPAGSKRLVRLFLRGLEGDVKAAKGIVSAADQTVLRSILRPDVSLVATLGQLNNAFAVSLIEMASVIESNILITRFERDDTDILHHYVKNEEMLVALNRDIQRIDLGIDQVHIIGENGGPAARFVHAGLEASLPLVIESQGTQSFFKIYPFIYQALAVGGIAVIDELDNAIHPAILPEIMGWFSDPDRNPHGAQLWMSCHAVSLLDDLLKEEVVICQKSQDGTTEIYRLADIQGIRRDTNLLQNYLGGVYGGVPSLG
jgi:hypothetical protein